MTYAFTKDIVLHYLSTGLHYDYYLVRSQDGEPD